MQRRALQVQINCTSLQYRNAGAETLQLIALQLTAMQIEWTMNGWIIRPTDHQRIWKTVTMTWKMIAVFDPNRRLTLFVRHWSPNWFRLVRTSDLGHAILQWYPKWEFASSIRRIIKNKQINKQTNKLSLSLLKTHYQSMFVPNNRLVSTPIEGYIMIIAPTKYLPTYLLGPHWSRQASPFGVYLMPPPGSQLSKNAVTSPPYLALPVSWYSSIYISIYMYREH